jgi:hypothetical protein
MPGFRDQETENIVRFGCAEDEKREGLPIDACFSCLTVKTSGWVSEFPKRIVELSLAL